MATSTLSRRNTTVAAIILVFLVLFLLLSMMPPVARASAGDIQVCSYSDAQSWGKRDSFYYSSISADGRYVAFESQAYNLGGIVDDNNAWDILRKDLTTGEVAYASITTGGEVGNGDSRRPSISADGRYVAFDTMADNLCSDSNGGVSEVLVKDMNTGAVARASVRPSGGVPKLDSWFPTISADGRYVSFQSADPTLTPDDTDEISDIFRKDMQTGAVYLCSTSSGGTVKASAGCAGASISADGRYVAFQSWAGNIFPGDTNNECDVFRKDTQTGELKACSAAADGTLGNKTNQEHAISPDGRYVAFNSYSQNFVPEDTDNLCDVYLKDLNMGEIALVSINASGVKGNEKSHLPSVSQDGRYVAFGSLGNNLVPGDTNGNYDIFRKDMKTGDLVLCSSNASGVIGNGQSNHPAITPDGKYVSFWSAAWNLVPDDWNGGFSDVFRKELPIGEPWSPYWYFAEGYTGAGFQEYLLLVNTGAEDASVNVTYLFTDGSSMVKDYQVKAESRVTIDVNAAIETPREVSMILKCNDPDVVPERSMYFTYNGVYYPGSWTGGHSVVGARSLESDQYFAEGFTGPNFDEYLVVLNPNPSAANLTFYFQTQEQGLIVKSGQVPANSRKTFSVNEMLEKKNLQHSTHVVSDKPVVAERPMYFDYLGVGAAHWEGGHCVMGAPSISKQYYFAEGTTRGWFWIWHNGFEEWLTLQNPNDFAITVSAEYQLGPGQGGPVTKTYQIQPGFRYTAFVPFEVGIGKDVSVKVSSSAPFFAERPMYFSYQGFGGYNWEGGSCVIGAFDTASEWAFAEGCTYWNSTMSFDEWLTLQNPYDADASVEITYYTQEAGALAPRYVTVKAHQRTTVMVDYDNHPQFPGGAGKNYNLGCRVKVVGGPGIVAERPMYWKFTSDGADGGSSTLGFPRK